jgi:FMNH2-dependent dimethyl sulfone monooxygenase
MEINVPPATPQPPPAVHPLRGSNKLKLGVFAQNMRGGAAITTAAGTLDGVWAEQPRIAQAADRAGFEFLLPVSRWRSLGGPSDFAGNVLEVFTWAAAVAAITDQIGVLATAHVPIFHPLLAAKQGATVDQIGNGRFGINVVVGWNAAEFDMFGIEQLPHHARYEVGAEWVEIVRRLWQQERVDFAGKYFTVRDGVLNPKPVSKPTPVFVNAGQSDTGMRFAAQHMDFTFQNHPDLSVLERSVAKVKLMAREEFDRNIDVISYGYVVCADTEKEARDYVRYYVDERGDFEAAQNLINQMLAGDSRSIPPEYALKMQRELIAGWGGTPLVGTPEQIVDQLARMSEIGVSGVALTWVNYADGVDQFIEQVVPLLRSAGLRD